MVKIKSAWVLMFTAMFPPPPAIPTAVSVVVDTEKEPIPVKAARSAGLLKVAEMLSVPVDGPNGAVSWEASPVYFVDTVGLTSLRPLPFGRVPEEMSADSVILNVSGLLALLVTFPLA